MSPRSDDRSRSGGQRQGGKGGGQGGGGANRSKGGRGQGRGKGGQGKAGQGKGGQGKGGQGKSRAQGDGRRRGGRPDADRVKVLSGPLRNVLRRLPDVEREVVEWRMGLKDGHPHDLGDTARELNLTVHEAKQIEQRALERIREVVPLDRLSKLLQG